LNFISVDKKPNARTELHGDRHVLAQTAAAAAEQQVFFQFAVKDVRLSISKEERLKIDFKSKKLSAVQDSLELFKNSHVETSKLVNPSFHGVAV